MASEDGLAFARHAFQRLDPVDLARADLVHRHIGVEHIDGLEVIWRGEVINARPCRILPSGSASTRRGWKHPGTPQRRTSSRPPGARPAAAQVPEAVIRDDLGGAEILEFGCIRPGFFRQADEQLGPLQVAIMVGGDIGDEIGGVITPNVCVANLNSI